MDEINVYVGEERSLPGQVPMSPQSPFDRRSGFFGVITEVQAKNNTVSIRADTGRIYTGVRVASSQWVTLPDDKDGQTKSKETLTGQRHLPPVNTCVYCLMPTGEPSSAIVLCSVFAYQESNDADFKEDSEDAAFTEKLIDNGGWMFTHDMRTGTRKVQNSPKDGEETISLEVNQEEEEKAKIIFKFFENTIEFDEEKQGWKQTMEGDIDLTVKGKMTAKVTGDVKVTTDGKADVEAGGDLSYKSTKTGLLEMGNSVATLGAMIDDLLQACISFKSVGSPATHTAPDFTAAVTQIKAKWTQVFK
ncbi:hypothetical protein FACS1894106_2420 [Spirochaetia bacterium]|nr:hypothetical protein FACS1894106_2420 [Spirochaetia bacterium]